MSHQALRPPLARTLVLLALPFLPTLHEASAQTGCRTGNCALSTTPPAGCANRASPFTLTVLLTSSGVNQIFLPANPKIEPGDCVLWKTVNTTHSSTADPCPDTGSICTTAPPAGCKWETGNIAVADSPPSETCFYDPTAYPAVSANGFYCRIHSSPVHSGTMFGSLNVTTPIVLLLSKDPVLPDALLSWSGGGVTGDVTYKVVRNLVADPSFAVGANTVTGDPTGGVTGTSFREANALLDPATHFYLVRNKQTNE